MIQNSSCINFSFITTPESLQIMTTVYLMLHPQLRSITFSGKVYLAVQIQQEFLGILLRCFGHQRAFHSHIDWNRKYIYIEHGLNNNELIDDACTTTVQFCFTWFSSSFRGSWLSWIIWTLVTRVSFDAICFFVSCQNILNSSSWIIFYVFSQFKENSHSWILLR